MVNYKRIQLMMLTFLFLCQLMACSSPKEQNTEANMQFIPEGTFLMGGDTIGNRRPTHKVYVDAFYIDIYEVTNEAYEEFILDGGYKKKEFWSDIGWKFVQQNGLDKPFGIVHQGYNLPRQPVVGISWYEASAYCKWAGKRLPTEAEWEKAARGTDGRKFPWGNSMDYARVPYRLSGGRRTMVVGSFPSAFSPYGVADMSGNVWEWVADWYDENYYKKDVNRNPRGPSTGVFRVLRGGSWSSNRFQLECSYRYHDKPDFRGFNVGFRCAQDAINK